MLYRSYRLLVAAVLAGSVAGIIYALANLAFISPLLHLAEGYEHAAHAHAHSEGGDDATIIIRAGLTLGLSLSLYIAYGLLLAAAMHLAQSRRHTATHGNPTITATTGIVWGLAGFTACHLAPAFVLSLSLPGLAHTHALPLASQQLWWWGIAGAVAAGLYLTAITREGVLRVVGMVVAASAILIPALILGNGQVGSAVGDVAGDVPAQLGALFASRSLGAHALGWAVLGYALSRSYKP